MQGTPSAHYSSELGFQASHRKVRFRRVSFCTSLKLCISLRDMDHGFNELERFLNLEIAAKKRELALEKDSDAQDDKNLFSRVVLASESEGSAGLSHEEIRGNVFIYLFAGVRFRARHPSITHTGLA